MKERMCIWQDFRKRNLLDNQRLDQIRSKITPDLSNGNYYKAFSAFITTSHKSGCYRLR
ncbi:hypothetical protein KHA80_07350 [Anaerobacillus sp. HL2]|nr:hypothetical protein KHA80_07350 [Anaerobacillus sp. HL2]